MRLPATIAGYVSNPFLFVSLWIGGGVASLLGATIYAELGTRFPKVGGPFVLVQQSMSNGFGFLTGWSDWIANVGALAYLSIATFEYVNKFFRVNLPLGLTSSVFVVLLSLLHWQGLRQSSIVQKVMSCLKAAGLLLFVIACFVAFFQGRRHTGGSVVPSGTPVPLFTALVLSFRAIFTTYFGFNNAVYYTEEDKNPQKNLPRSLLLGVISVMLIYVLVNISLILVLPLPKIADSILPVADVAQLIFGNNGEEIVTVLAIVFLAGIANATLLLTPRILYAIAKAGLFFEPVARLNKQSIPGNALLITTVVAVLLSLTGVFNLVLNVTVLFAIVVDLLVYVSILFVRRQGSNENSYKAKGYPYNAILMICITLGLIIALFFEDTTNCIYSSVLLFVAFVLYQLIKRFQKA